MSSINQHLFHPGSIKGKFTWATMGCALLALFFAMSTLLLRNNAATISHNLSQQLQPTYTALQQLKSNCNEATVLLSSYAYEPRQSTKQIIIDQVIAQATAAIDIISDTLIAGNLLDFNQRRELKVQYASIRAKVIDELNKAASVSLTNEINNTVLPQIIELNRLAERPVASVQLAITQAQQKLNTLHKQLLTLGIVFILIMALYLGYILWRYSKLNQQIAPYQKVAHQLGEGNIPQMLPQSHDETHALRNYLNQFFEQLQQVKSFAQRVGQGEFDNDITVFNNQGDLGGSLFEMKESLSKVAKADIQRNWVNEGFARFGDILRQNDDLEKLADDLVSQLVKYLDANQGALFLVTEDDASNQPYLKPRSCYAYNKHKMLNATFLLGEGLVGRAWQENDTIFITEIPENYINIKSGLGGANPTCIVAQPLTHNDRVIGVIEVASFQVIPPYRLEFIKRLAENIASTIATTFGNEKTKDLLEEAQQMTEEMKAQEEEMRQNMEELQATQEEMRRTQLDVKTKEHNLSGVINNTNDTIFAIDTQYRITVVNDALRQRYAKLGISLKAGINIFDVLPTEKWEHWKARYDRALSGERFKKVEKTTGTAGTQWSETFHNPIRNNQGQVVGVSVISRDITEVVSMQEEVRKKQSVVNTLINNTDETYFAIDLQYRITVVNDTLKGRFEASGISLKAGDYIFDKLPKDTHTVWKERYDRALKGESFIIPQERKVNEQTLYIEGYYNPIKDEEGNIIGASVMSKDITRQKRAEDEVKALKAKYGST